MGTSADYIEFVCEQIRGVGAIRYRKMFGEYMVYVNDKPILLVCDNTVFIKKLEGIETVLRGADVGVPYQGAKEYYILDIEQPELAKNVAAFAERVTAVPKPKPRKKTRTTE